jgi:hypothetical protein
MPTTINGSTGVSLVQDGTITSAKILDGSVAPVDLAQKLTLGTAQDTTSGTSVDFTGIPSWAKRITVMFNGVSTNGTSLVQIQLGTSSGIDASSYLGASQNLDATTISTSTNFTTGFRIMASAGGSVIFQGFSTIVLLSSTTFCFNSLVGRSDYTGQFMSSGSKTLSGDLDRLRLTTVNGTDLFDAGSVNILYEG